MEKTFTSSMPHSYQSCLEHLEILQRTVATAPKQLQMHEWIEWYEKTEWYQWRTAHPRIRPDLSGADLRSMGTSKNPCFQPLNGQDAQQFSDMLIF